MTNEPVPKPFCGTPTAKTPNELAAHESILRTQGGEALADGQGLALGVSTPA